MADVKFYVSHQIQGLLHRIKDNAIPYEIIRDTEDDAPILRAKFPADEFSFTGFETGTKPEHVIIDIPLYSSPEKAGTYLPYSITLTEEEAPDYQPIPDSSLSNLYTE